VVQIASKRDDDYTARYGLIDKLFQISRQWANLLVVYDVTDACCVRHLWAGISYRLKQYDNKGGISDIKLQDRIMLQGTHYCSVDYSNTVNLINSFLTERKVIIV